MYPGFFNDILPFAGSRTFYGREKMDSSFNATETWRICLSLFTVALFVLNVGTYIYLANCWILPLIMHGFFTARIVTFKILHRRTLKQFRLELAITLMHNDREITRIYDPISEGQKIKQPKQIRPVQSLQYDHVQHYPGVGNLHRCKFCTNGRSTIICLKFEESEVKKERNCFAQFHDRPVEEKK